MSRLDDIAERTPTSFRLTAWLIMALLVAVTAWAYWAELEEVAIAQGVVVPQGQVKVIQHLEGGIITTIHVTEGTRVATGDPLVQLDHLASDSDREELAVRLDALLLTRARLTADAKDEEPVFPGDVAARRPELVDAERATYRARQDELASGLKVLAEQARQREHLAAELSAKQTSLERDLVLMREELAMSSDLLKDGLTPKIEHLKVKRQVERLEGERAVLDEGIPRANAALAEMHQRIKEERIKFRRVALEELGKIELRIVQTREGLARATDELARTEIQSPIDGVVKSLRYHTIGGVVRPGDAIMEIVPTGDKLVIEAKLNPTDIGYVRIGQPAVVKISTYDFVRYGSLEGKVIDLSPDTHVDQNGETYFRIIASTDKAYLGDEPGDYPIAPGMQAQVDIHTGRKSVLAYILNPVLRLKSDAFRER